jgi:hypothetical protein
MYLSAHPDHDDDRNTRERRVDSSSDNIDTVVHKQEIIRRGMNSAPTTRLAQCFGLSWRRSVARALPVIICRSTASLASGQCGLEICMDALSFMYFLCLGRLHFVG